MTALREFVGARAPAATHDTAAWREHRWWRRSRRGDSRGDLRWRQVAAQAGNRRAARQVAWALRVYSDRGLPWQRVLGAGGVIRLPEGGGLERQRALLLAEGVAVDAGGRLDLAAYQWRP